MRQLWLRSHDGTITCMNYEEGFFTQLRGFTDDALEFLRDINNQMHTIADAAKGAASDPDRRPRAQETPRPPLNGMS